MPNWEEIQKEWETSEISFKDLAEKYNVKDSTIRSRKNREKWSRGNVKRDATNATQRKQNVATKKVVKEAIVESDDLTDKQRLFCIYYIKYFNATKAYQKAYEVDRNTAESIAYRLMGKDGVKTEIQRLKKQRLNEAYFDKYDVLQKYKDIAFADMTDFAEFGSEEVVARNEFGQVMTDDDGKEITYTHNFVNFKNAGEVDGTIITEVKKGKDGISVKLADKMKAMEMLAKFTDLLSDNDKKRLQEEKLKVEIVKVKAETNTDETCEGKTIIVTGEDEMRRVLDGKSSV
ncbi:terminase small subunit [Sporosarcina psychrophila]|uniref:terminase small subunit n=1 Tax=Sporosarcina psychrophila TaxID=1476 RepID=UPI00078CBE65|nr:terminase small subunit [Sporosarcina psychrophila]AMQ06744.1 terminase [Sporosarcina psychrophila]